MSSPDAEGLRDLRQANMRRNLETARGPLTLGRAFRCICIAWDSWPERWDAALAYRARHGLALSEERMQDELASAGRKVRP